MFQRALTVGGGGGGAVTIEKGNDVLYSSAYNVFVDTGLKAEEGSFYFSTFSVNGSYNSLYEYNGGTFTAVSTSAGSFPLEVLANGNIGVKQTYQYGDWASATLWVYKIS